MEETCVSLVTKVFGGFTRKIISIISCSKINHFRFCRLKLLHAAKYPFDTDVQRIKGTQAIDNLPAAQCAEDHGKKSVVGECHAATSLI